MEKIPEKQTPDQQIEKLAAEIADLKLKAEGLPQGKELSHVKAMVTRREHEIAHIEELLRLEKKIAA